MNGPPVRSDKLANIYRIARANGQKCENHDFPFGRIEPPTNTFTSSGPRGVMKEADRSWLKCVISYNVDQFLPILSQLGEWRFSARFYDRFGAPRVQQFAHLH